MDTTERRGGKFEKYLVNCLAKFPNVGGFGAPTVLGLIFAGWRQFGRKLHAEETTVVFYEKCKNTTFWPKYGFFGTLALFLDDVSMMSSGGVEVG